MPWVKRDDGTTRQELAALMDQIWVDSQPAEVDEADLEQLCTEAMRFPVAAVCVKRGWGPPAARAAGGTFRAHGGDGGVPVGRRSRGGQGCRDVWAAKNGAVELDMV